MYTNSGDHAIRAVCWQPRHCAYRGDAFFNTWPGQRVLREPTGTARQRLHASAALPTWRRTPAPSKAARRAGAMRQAEAGPASSLELWEPLGEDLRMDAAMSAPASDRGTHSCAPASSSAASPTVSVSSSSSSSASASASAPAPRAAPAGSARSPPYASSRWPCAGFGGSARRAVSARLVPGHR